MDLLKDDIRKLYKAYLVPSLSAAVVTSVYSFADMVAIGRGVGPDGAAALSIATPIFGVISFFGVLCGIGGSIHLSKARGEKRLEKSNAYFSASLLMTLVLTALVWVFFLAFSRPIYTFFVDVTPEILKIAPGIVRIYFLSFLFMEVNIQAIYYLQSVMRTQWAAVLALLRRLVLSSILVYLLPFFWGIDGVWWAMAITEFAVVILSVVCMVKADKAGMEKGKA